MQIGGVMRTRIVTAKPDETAGAAIERMLEAGIGSIVVCDGPSLTGIFTERDVLRLAGTGESFRDKRLSEVMTERPVTITAEDGILDATRLMEEKKIRHLPVVEGDNLVGIVSIRDVLAFLVERVWQSRDENARDTARAILRG
jgi:CBS domain-containing protein